MASILQRQDVSRVGLRFKGEDSDSSDDGYCFLEGARDLKMGFTICTQNVPQLGDQVDWNQIHTWPLISRDKEGDLPDGFRVINVLRNCIESPSHRVDYVSLSYVWGQTSANDFQATLGNIKQLELENSLSRIQLPRTIQDAMFACRQLGQKYLWVDRLCILQDDEESKHGQIACMDGIFGSSVFTIVALNGSNAQSGLSGVSRPRLEHLKKFEWQGLSLLEETPRLVELITNSTWGKRGWTYQEEFCSASNLYFTDYGLYHSSHHAESYTEFPSSYYPHRKLSFSFPGSIKMYTTRSLSFPEDILRACTGVLTRVYEQKHCFGIPFDKFDSGIHWQPIDWKHQRRSSLKEIFPSWSWSSAHGSIEFISYDRTVSLWALPASTEPGKPKALRWISRKKPAAHLKSLTVVAGTMDAAKFPFNRKERRKDLSSPCSLSVFNEHDRRRAHERPGRILSFTQVAIFGIQNLHYQFSDGRCTFSIRSVQDECVGGIWLTAPSSEHVKGDNDALKGKDFEFMALSYDLSTHETENIILGTGRDYDPNSLSTEINEARLDLKTRRLGSVNVMLICRDEANGVARRVGVGKVFLEAWRETRPELKTVVLE